MLVRDDFWMAANRFMRELEIDLVPDQNIAAVDLFDRRTHKRCWERLASAYGKLPERVGDLDQGPACVSGSSH